MEAGQPLAFYPIWFEVIRALMFGLSLITPPIGMNVFFIGGMSEDIFLHPVFKGVWPFVIPLIAVEVMSIGLLDISLFLPNTMMALK